MLYATLIDVRADIFSSFFSCSFPFCFQWLVKVWGGNTFIVLVVPSIVQVDRVRSTMNSSKSDYLRRCCQFSVVCEGLRGKYHLVYKKN